MPSSSGIRFGSVEEGLIADALPLRTDCFHWQGIEKRARVLGRVLSIVKLLLLGKWGAITQMMEGLPRRIPLEAKMLFSTPW